MLKLPNAALDELDIIVSQQEITFVSVQHGYAGTADVYGTRNKKKVVLDWKSGNGLYDSAALQLVALANCEHYIDSRGNLVPLAKSDIGIAVQLGDGQYRTEQVTINSDLGHTLMDAFLGLIPVWRFKTGGLVWEN